MLSAGSKSSVDQEQSPIREQSVNPESPTFTKWLTHHRKILFSDLDRTIINTTGWYHACATPGILLDPAGAQRFRELNAAANGTHGHEGMRFRLQTLSLLNSRNSSAPVTQAALFEAGRLVACRSHVYPEALAFIRAAQNDYGEDFGLVIATAGYDSFAMGLVTELLRRAGLSGLPLVVIASELHIERGKWEIARLVDLRRKTSVLQTIQSSGCHILAVAEDQYHDSELFSWSRPEEPCAIRVKHTSGRQSSPEWEAAVVALVRTGSFTQAAVSLHVTQSALSSLIKELEQSLGVRLVERSTRSIGLTEAGRGFVPLIDKILQDLDGVLGGIDDLKALRRGVVRVAAPQLMACTLMPEVIAAYRREHPGVQVRLSDCAVDGVLAQELAQAGAVAAQLGGAGAPQLEGTGHRQRRRGQRGAADHRGQGGQRGQGRPRWRGPPA